MSAVLRVILDKHWRYQQNRRLVFLASGLALTFFGWSAWRFEHTLDETLGALLCTGVLGLWGIWIHALLSINAPIQARLVPGNVEALRTHLQLGTLVTAALWGLSSSLLSGSLHVHRFWFAWIALVIMTCAMRRLWLWVPLYGVIILNMGLTLQLYKGPSDGEPMTWLYTLGILSTALLGWPLLTSQIGAGSAAHRRTWAKRAEWTSLAAGASGSRSTSNQSPRVLYWLALVVTWPMALQRRALQRGGGGSAMSRLELGLWPASAHPWVTVVWSVYYGLFLLLTPDPYRMTMSVALLIGWVSLINGQFRERSLARTHSEQSLLALLPGPPQGGALARALAWRGWAFGVLAWAVLLGPWLWVSGGFRPEYQSAGAALFAVALVSVPSLMQNWGQTRPRARAIDPWAFVALVFFLAFMWDAHLPLSPYWLIPAGSFASAAFTLHRARQLQQATACLPAGRQTYSGNSV